MPRVYMSNIEVQVAKDQNGRMKAAAEQRAEEVFLDSLAGMVDDFENHPVTVELDGGINAPNLSGTLRGGEATENLYSFIGFEAGDSPTDPIRKQLDPDTPGGPSLQYTGKGKTGNNAKFGFRIASPSLEEIYRKTPMPWATGLSWAQKIQSAIPGFARFLPKRRIPQSRSGGGIQLDNPLPSKAGARFTPPEDGYLKGIFTRFIDRVKNRSFRKRFL